MEFFDLIGAWFAGLGQQLSKLMPILTEGMGTTMAVFFLTILFSVPLGIVLSLGKMCRFKPLSWLVKAYISVMRGTPLILQIMFVYFAPYYILGPGYSYDRFVAVILALTLNYAAYYAEIFRGGIQSIPAGQREAAKVLGFSRSQSFFRIILPQVVKRVLPPFANEVITLVKDTALVQVIGVVELFGAAVRQQTAMFSVFPLFVAGVYYFLFNWLVSLVFSFCEKKLNYYS